MALTQADIDELDLAIASGELTVKLNDREITYRSVTELMKARRHVNRMVNGANANPLGGMKLRVDRGL